MRKPQSLTKPQIAAYFRAAGSAARALGEPLDAYRKRIMKEVCNATSIKQLNRTSDYDAVMTRFAEDSSDYEAACHFATGSGRRLATLTAIVCEQVIQLRRCQAAAQAEPIPDGDDLARYLNGVLRQSAKLTQFVSGPWWLDIADRDIRSVFLILDTHRRRLVRRMNQASGARVTLAFDPLVGYRVDVLSDRDRPVRVIFRVFKCRENPESSLHFVVRAS